MFRKMTFIIVGLALHLPAGAEVVGRWCDMPVPRMPAIDSVITIQTDAAGTYSLSIVYADSSKTAAPVRREGSRFFTDNDFGEFYSQKPDGRLSINDNDGFIRTAMPTQSNDPKACR